MSGMRLAALLEGLARLPTTADRPVRRLDSDSRRIEPGDVFVALAGNQSHGLHHAGEALARGAAAVLYDPAERAPEGLASPAAIAVDGLRARLGELADRANGSPSARLRVVGVTGTNGKTSTVQLLAQALERLGCPAATIGTLGAGRVGRLQAGTHTTPDVLSVHALLARLLEQGARAVAMEVSSHALDQGRVDGVRFELAVFTNLSRDHLDYHHSMQAYAAAKLRLGERPGLRAWVRNLDDDFAAGLAAGLAAADAWTVSAAGRPEARLRAENLLPEADGLRFDLVEGPQRTALRSPLLGRFNVDNLLAVAASLRALGFGFDEVAGVLPGLEPVSGRMTRLGGGGRPLVVVDYAHTPDALAQALQSLRGHVRGRLICVFGCGGDRDRGKRPLMAAAAEAHADRVIVTDDNPRSEDGDAIVAAICAGFREPARHRVIRDRRAAIRAALGDARAQDLVLLAGKGHEPWQEVAGRRLPFDDLAEARAALESAI